MSMYRYCIYPTQEPVVLLNRPCGSVWYVCNWALDLATKTYQTQGADLTRFQLDKRFTAACFLREHGRIIGRFARLSRLYPCGELHP
jgi:hypothetical protein